MELGGEVKTLCRTNVDYVDDVDDVGPSSQAELFHAA